MSLKIKLSAELEPESYETYDVVNIQIFLGLYKHLIFYCF